MTALVDVIMKVQRLAVDLADELAELDINPLVVLPSGRRRAGRQHGAVALDALAVRRERGDDRPKPPTSCADVENGVLWITLNRPDAGNAMKAEMRNQIADWLDEASGDPRGPRRRHHRRRDKGFCTGADLRGGRPRPRPDPRASPERIVGDAARMIRTGWQRLVGIDPRLREAGDRGRQRARRPAAACTWRWPAISW